jgi:hypothetical protein
MPEARAGRVVPDAVEAAEMEATDVSTEVGTANVAAEAEGGCAGGNQSRGAESRERRKGEQ